MEAVAATGAVPWADLKGRAMADSKSDRNSARQPPNAALTVGNRRFSLPGNRVSRIALGVAFILGGLVGFLPVVGFWMIPVGLLILSHDIRWIRRRRRRLMIWAGRRWEKKTDRD